MRPFAPRFLRLRCAHISIAYCATNERLGHPTRYRDADAASFTSEFSTLVEVCTGDSDLGAYKARVRLGVRDVKIAMG